MVYNTTVKQKAEWNKINYGIKLHVFYIHNVKYLKIDKIVKTVYSLKKNRNKRKIKCTNLMKTKKKKTLTLKWNLFFLCLAVNHW